MADSNGHVGRDRTAIKKQAFLAGIRECGTIVHAAKASGVGRQTHYDWMENDPEYAKQFAEAMVEAAEGLETEAIRRAKEGVMRPKFYKGEMIIDPRTGEPYLEDQRSDVLLIFLMKGAMPEKYRERVSVKDETEEPRVAGRDRDDAIRERAQAMLDSISSKEQ